MRNIVTILLMSLGLANNLTAHDTWLEAGPLQQPVGEYTYVNLMLGNHGNNHRDFKLASKVTLTHCTLSVLDPAGKKIDLKPSIIDMGNAAKEGFWSARYEFSSAGVHEFLHTLDTLHGSVRAVKSAKTYVVGWDNSSDRPQGKLEPLGLGLELVLRSDLHQVSAGQELRVQVLRNGKPLAGAAVTFVPRGTVLAEGFDAQFERKSDADGQVSFTPENGNILLAIVHHHEPMESGEGYESTHYGAAMVLPILNRKTTKVSRLSP